jgi:hypothetical protein
MMMFVRGKYSSDRAYYRGSRAINRRLIIANRRQAQRYRWRARNTSP